MKPADALKRWNERLRDRARVGSFARFLVKRFLDDRLFQAAAALAYTTIFALVPLTMVVFGVLSAFPGYEEWSQKLGEYVFSNFVPSAAASARQYLLQLSSNRAQLTAAGVVALVFSLLITLNSIEATFNQIWRVPESRPRLVRFLVYWTVLTLGALLAAASLAISARFFALPLFETEQGRVLANTVLTVAPVVIELFAITAIYRVVPHRPIKLRYAFAGALIATLLLEVVKWALGLYLGNFNSYQTLYGPLAVVPILMLWIYLCWVAILIGASTAATSAAFRYQPASMRLPVGFELYGLLRMVGRFHQARARGEGLSDDRLLKLEPMLTDALVQEFLAALCRIKLVRCDENGEWILARDLDTVTLSELYEAAQLRVPVSEAHLPFQDDALGTSVRDALNRLRMPMRDLLKHKVAEIYPSPAELSSP
ncbi:YihY family inner membrane protein [Pseudoxanthomonas composti]|uniref:UPF0761 membrane protein EPA99_13130 n=1 Tax=Pseudoxanthomonas composti TaxID=2137479 RepID=A0A4Q1JTT0_9GAMM|nr:YihY family inner membrane protein [Pseudoxanthomonas composti]RXR04406.1 YihY family inner membrane protein [Pseudoxanthomonas composti]